VPKPVISGRPKTKPPTAPGFVAPNAPTGVSAAQGSPSTSTLRVSFTPGTDANDPAATITANKLYGADTSGGTSTYVATLGPAATYGDESSLPPEQARYYRVSTVNQHGLESALSPEVTATTEAGEGGAAAVEPSIRTLELISPIAAGTGSPAMHSGHRIYKAYTGLAYSIRCVVIGGSYPYTFELANGGGGMTIDADTGEINWSSPASNCTPTVTVTDSEGTQVQGTWTITVGTTGFKFIDGDAVTSGDGTIGSPLKTLTDVKNGGATFSDILYFRESASAYTLGGDTPSSGASLNGAGYLNLGFDDSGGVGRPMVWLAYPGESPVIDFRRGLNTYGSINGPFDAPYIKLTGPNIYIDGLTLTNDRTKCFELDCTTRRAPVVRNVTTTSGGAGDDGSNSAFFMFTAGSGGQTSYGLAVQDCNFGSAGHNAIKSYSLNKSVIEDNILTSNDGIAQKDGVPLYTVRNNVFNTCSTCVAGNMNTRGGVDVTYGEVCYNLMLNPTTSALQIGVGKISAIGRTDIYRNTFIGAVIVQNLATADGPYNFRHNIKINSAGGEAPWPNITDVAISNSTRVTLDNDLNGAAADGIVDASGNLQGAYLTAYGPATVNPRGYELP
jgi:hypothetical protein